MPEIKTRMTGQMNSLWIIHFLTEARHGRQNYRLIQEEESLEIPSGYRFRESGAEKAKAEIWGRAISADDLESRYRPVK